MAKISINLLPPEIMEKELKRARFYQIQLIGIIIILFVFFLTSLVMVLRILQSRNISIIQAALTEKEREVTDFKDTQSSIFILKDRLNVIDKFFGITSEQASLFKLLNKLIPESAKINGISIDNAGSVTLLATVPDSTVLVALLSNLSQKETNDGRIKVISVDSLNRGKDGFYRISLKLTSS